MQPNPLRYYNKEGEEGADFGEVNENNMLHGRGIRLSNDGFIKIGYFEDGRLSTGHYIYIFSHGEFFVGELY